MKHNDFVFSVAKMFEAREQGIGVVEQIGEDDDEAASFDAFGQVVKCDGQVGVGAFGGGCLKGGEQRMKHKRS